VLVELSVMEQRWSTSSSMEAWSRCGARTTSSGPSPALEKGGYARSEPMGYTSMISRLRSVKHQPVP